MSKHAAPAPKHRKAPQRPLTEAPKKVFKTTVLVSSLAVGGTGTAVAAGVALHAPAPASTGSADLSKSAASFTPPTASQSSDPNLRAERRAPVSRSLDRRSAEPTKPDPAKRAALESVAGDGHTSAITRTEDIADSDPKSIASALLSSFGWSSDQFSCLDSLWTKESGWSVTAYNPSGAYGIPQALPGSKMASEGPDWQTNPETQIKWGLGYIQDRYGSPCGAWAHSESYNWY